MVTIKEAQNDKEKLNKFIDENQGLVYMVIKKNFNHVIGKQEHDDYIQVGMMGLLEAVKRFNPKYGFKFSTYAVPMISGKIKSHVRDYDYGIINVPRPIRENSFKVFGLIQKGKTEEEICSKLNITHDEFVNSVRSFQHPAYFGDIVNSTKKDGKGITIEETISNNVTAEDEVMKQIEFREKFDTLKKFLNEKERKVLDLHLNEFNQQKIAGIVNISQSAVSRILVKIKKVSQKALDYYENGKSA